MGIHIRAYNKTGAALGILPDFTDLKEQENDDGTGTITFDYLRDGVNASWLDMDELLLCVIEDGVAHSGYYMLEEDTDDPATALSRGRFMKVSARSYMGVLDQAVVYPAGADSTGSNLYGLAPQHKFDDKSPGNIMGVLINEAKARGCFPELTYSFTSAVDSAGRAWPKNYDITYPSGMDYLTVLSDMVEDGWVDARMEQRVLKLYVPDTYFGQTGWLLRYGQNVLSAPRKRSRRGIFSHVLAAGDAAKKANLQVSNSTTATRFGRREGYVADGRLTTTASLTTMANRELTKHQQQREGFTLEMILDPPPGDWWPRPGIDFKVGDRLYYDKARKSATEFQPMLVRSMTWSWGDTKSAPKCSIELNDLFVKQSIAAAKQLGAIAGGSSTGKAPAPTAPAPDTIPPAAPGSVWVDAFSELVTTGILDPVYRCTATVTWTPVDYDSDGSLLSDFDQYEVSIRVNGGTWSAVRPSTDTTDVYVDLQPGQMFQARVRAMDKWGNRSGFTTSDAVLMPVDTTPPPAPSVPILTTRAGTVTVAWDGMDNTPAPMPDDFRHLEVWQGSEATFATSPKLIDRIIAPNGSIVVAGQTYGVPMFYRFVAVDVSGNKSTPGASASIATSQLVTGDLAADAVTDIALAPNAVREENILAGSIGVSRLAVADTSNMADLSQTKPGQVVITGANAYTDEAVTHSDGTTWSRRTPETTPSTYFKFRAKRGPIPWQTGDRVRITFEAFMPAGGADVAITTQIITYPATASYFANLTARPGFPTSISGVPRKFAYEVDIPANLVDGRTEFEVGITAPSFANGTVKPWVRNVRMYRMGAGELLVDGSIQAQHMTANSVKTDSLEAGAVSADKISLGVIRSNLVPDPSFEEPVAIPDVSVGAFDKWRSEVSPGGGEVRKDAGRGRSGAYGLTLYVSSAGASARALSGVMAVTPGATYKLSFYACASNANVNMVVEMIGGSAKTSLTTTIVPDPDGEPVQPPAVTMPPAPTDFVQYSYEFVPAAGITFAAVRISNSAPAAVVSLVVDDVAVVQKGAGGASEVTAAGLRLFDDEGLEVGAFVSNRPNYFSVSKGGQTVAAIDENGTAAFTMLDVVGAADVTTNIGDTYGLTVGGEDYADRLGRLPQGIVAQTFKGGTLFTVSKIRTEYGLYEISWLAYPGRFYRVTSSGGTVTCPTSDVGVSAIQRFRYTNDGTTPNISSTLARTLPVPIPANKTFGLPPMIVQGNFIGGATVPTLVRLLYTLNAGNAGGTDYIDFSNQAGTSLAAPIECVVEDLGLDVPDSFLTNSGGGTLYTGGTDSSGGGSSPTPKKTYTSSWVANSSDSYGNYGARPEADLYQGYYSSNQGHQWASILFTGANSTGGETGKTIAQALSGATVRKVEVYLRNTHWYYNSGGTAVVRAQTSTSLITSTPTGTAKNFSSWSEGAGKWVDITSISTSGIRGVTLGKAPSTSLTYYGQFANHTASSGKPVLRITYDR